MINHFIFNGTNEINHQNINRQSQYIGFFTACAYYNYFLQDTIMNSIVLGQKFEGDFTIESGQDTLAYGYGSLNVNKNTTIYGTTPSTCSTDGALVVYGGFGLLGDANFQDTLNVLYNTTNLSETNINNNLNVSGSRDAVFNNTGIFQASTGNISLYSDDIILSTTVNSGIILNSGGNSFYVGSNGLSINTTGSIIDGFLDISGIMTITNTTSTINTGNTIGALIVSGGIVGKTNVSIIGTSFLNNTEISDTLLVHGSGDATITNNGIITIDNSAGSIILATTGNMYMNAQNQINIGTLNNTPIVMGTSLNTTTILGNLDVKGIMTRIDSVITTFADNILITNNTPIGLSNSGLGIKRYQPANDSLLGDVVNNASSIESNTVGSLGNSTSTINLGAVNTSVDLIGVWVKLVDGTGAGQVRRIKEYDSGTNIATIYTDVDQTINPIIPIEGLDFITIPDSTTVYELYKCYYQFCIWDESNDEFAFTCNSIDDVISPIAHYSNVHLGALTCSSITSNSFSSTSDFILTVNLDNSSTVPIPITGLQTFGIYSIMIRPTTENTRPHAKFDLTRINDPSTPGTRNRVLNTPGLGGGTIDIQWPANSLPELFYKIAPNIVGTTEYTLRIQTV